MGFISFNEKYYRKKLEEFEKKILTSADIYEIKKLLKILDDLADEGYTKLNDYMEKEFLCLKRLHALLKKVKEKPFPINNKNLLTVSYEENEYELSKLLNIVIERASKVHFYADNPFLRDIYKYSKWINYDKKVAYIFLLRDTLLPYVYFYSRNSKNIYPWLISRSFLEDITKVKNFDDNIRAPIYEALESGLIDFKDFFAFCKKKVLAILREHPILAKTLKNLLYTISEQKIVVVESGYVGTIPLLLKSIDDRVQFKMYTTAPYLYETYKNNIFCQRYEDLRKFETLYSQEYMIKYSSYKNGKFYVKITEDEKIKNKALEEVKFFTI